MEDSRDKTRLELAEDVVRQRIFLIRGQRVMVDSDLAKLFGVRTKELNKAIKRNLLRFPPSFMFQVNEVEYASLRFQIGTSNVSRGGRRYLPYVFTEHGVAMLSVVLNSEKAIKMSIFIIQAFIKMRESLLETAAMDIRLTNVEVVQEKQGKLLEDVVKTLNKITDKPSKRKGPMGYIP